VSVYYNEINPWCVAQLRKLIARGLIADGEVDSRSIVDVRADDLRGFAQCHFFAGIGGWSLALRRAGWADDRPVWSGSCPCGPFSNIGEMERFADERHLWPDWVRLIEKRKPPVVFGEQVASATEWLRLVRCDLESLGYAVGAAPIEAASAGAEHFRDRFWFVGAVVDGIGPGLEGHAGDVDRGPWWTDPAGSIAPAGFQFDVYQCADGKRRRAQSGVRLLADGIPDIVDRLTALGNAIDPRPAAEFIGAYMDICVNKN
jgi:DNA (cytosine-5)-methyltransferase 1